MITTPAPPAGIGQDPPATRAEETPIMHTAITDRKSTTVTTIRPTPGDAAKLAALHDYLRARDPADSESTAAARAAAVVLCGRAWLDLWARRGRRVARRMAERDVSSIWRLWCLVIIGLDATELAWGKLPTRRRVGRIISTARRIRSINQRDSACVDTRGFERALREAMELRPSIEPRSWSIAGATVVPERDTTMAHYLATVASVRHYDDSSARGSGVTWRLLTTHADVGAVLRAAAEAHGQGVIAD